MIKTYILSLLLWIFLPLTLFAQKESVFVIGSQLKGSSDLEKSLKKNGFQIHRLSKNDTDQLDAGDARLLILGGDKPLPPGSRTEISRYLQEGGNLILVGSGAFDYTPKPIYPVALLDLGDSKQYQLVEPPRERRLASMDQINSETVEEPDGGKGLRVFTKDRGMRDVYAMFSIRRFASATRSVLTFKAKGNYYLDLLALEIIDKSGEKWIGFVQLSRAWEDYSLSLADFIPKGWDQKGAYPLLDPVQVDSLAIGVNLNTVWREKPMSFSIASVTLSENENTIYAPTSAQQVLRLPFKENQTSLPQWVWDPFYPVPELEEAVTLVPANGSPVHKMRVSEVQQIQLPAHTLVEFPGSIMGTDTKNSYDHRLEKERRTIPILATEDRQTVARLDVYAGGPYAGSVVAAFGVGPGEAVRHPGLLNSIAQTADYILRTPRVLQIRINTTAQRNQEPVVPEFKITLQNPTDRKIQGKLHLNIEGMPNKIVDVEIPKRQTLDHIVQLGQVPLDFPFKKFQWNLELTTPNTRDEVRNLVDVERSMLQAFVHLVKAQKAYPDGRYSHHYFGDAYGVRAMFAYLNFLERHPGHLEKNQDLWEKISPEEIRASALQFCDMLVERQLPSGALPMGYSEHAGGSNVADGGQMVLALAQLSQYVKDEKKRAAYLNVCYRFFEWAESFYIDQEKSESLKRTHPEAYDKGQAKAGLYGLGLAGRSRQETGSSWVLSDILGAQIYLAYIDKNYQNVRYREITKRNVDFYAKARYSAAGYYQAEALFWSWLTSPDPAIKALIAANLKETFLAPLYKGKQHDMYDVGSRSTLRALSLLYYQQFLENTPGNRAVLLKYIWSFGSNGSQSSVRNLSRNFPKAVHGESLAAAKYAALSALWAMELLEPGSTLFKGVPLNE